MNKDAVIGLTFLVVAITIVVLVGGIYGLVYIGIPVIFGFFALGLYAKKSRIAKLGAFVVFPDLLYRLLMPRKTKRIIKSLEETEIEHNKSLKERDALDHVP